MSAILQALVTGRLAQRRGAMAGRTAAEQQRDREAERRRVQSRDTLDQLRARDELGLVDDDDVGATDSVAGAPMPSMALNPTAGVLRDRHAARHRGESVELTDPADGTARRFRVDRSQSRAERDRLAQRAREDEVYARTRTDQQADAERERDTANRTAFATFQQMFPRDRLAREPYNPQVSYAPIVQRAQQLEGQDRSFAQQMRLQDRSDARAARSAATHDGDGKPPSEGERTAASFLIRMAPAGRTLDAIKANDIPSWTKRQTARLPGIGNSAVGEQYQLWRQAGEEFLASVLRKESGAAISDQEFDRYAAIYLPMPGDTDATVSRKAEARARAMQQMGVAAGRALREVVPLLESQQPAADTRVNPFRR